MWHARPGGGVEHLGASLLHWRWQARGHRIEAINDSYQDFGAGQFIWRLGEPGVEGYVGASDARRDGLVAGF